MSVLEISFLAFLLFTIHFYTVLPHPGKGFFFDLFNEKPLLLITLFFVFFSMKNLAGFLVLRMQYLFVYGVASRLSKNNLLYYLEGSYAEYVNIHSSVHSRRINQQPIEFCHYVLWGFQQIISQSILILITILVTLIYNPELFLLLFIILTPPVILTGYLIKRKMSSLRNTAKPVSERALQYLAEALSGFVESNLYDRKEFFANRYYTYQSKFNNFLANLQVMQNMPTKLIEVFAIFGFFILIVINNYSSYAAPVQLITIGAFMGASYKIIPGIVKILNCLGQVKTYGFTVEDLLKHQRGSTGKEKQRGKSISSVTFSGVSFAFKNNTVLDNFSLQLDRGDFIGLSGISGSGKTTTINLLLGFLNPCSGTIRINDASTNAADRQQYWERISYVKQQPFLISDSILVNIILEENLYNQQRYDNVIQAAGLQDLSGLRPELPNRLLNENGRNLSGGQRQRIAFARALYKESDLFILDEPFSELDEEAERKMLQYCMKLTDSGKTILLITHNKKNLSLCHKIAYLNES